MELLNGNKQEISSSSRDVMYLVDKRCQTCRKNLPKQAIKTKHQSYCIKISKVPSVTRCWNKKQPKICKRSPYFPKGAESNVFQNRPKSHRRFGLLFRDICCQELQKSPNLVTLGHLDIALVPINVSQVNLSSDVSRYRRKAILF